MQPLEVWQRGPLPNIPALLQPVAHALLQAQEELKETTINFPDELLWERPAGVASVGFHLQHLSGVLDRVFTYARNEALTDKQLAQLQAEDVSPQLDNSIKKLIDRFNNQIENCLFQLQNTDSNTLTEYRSIGRKKLPSTHIGLLVHAAEHTMRHIGQLRVTAIFLLHNSTPV